MKSNNDFAGITRRTFIKGIGAGAATMMLTGANFSPSPADCIFLNGRVYTLDPKHPWAEAVAIKKNLIVGVGLTHDIMNLKGEKTRIIDLKGKMLMPGFIDGHNHFLAGAVAKRGVKLLGINSKADMLKKISDYVKANPELRYYTGYDWTYEAFGEKRGTRHDLDVICRDKPVFIFNDDSHSVWFNTKAMEIAGLSKTTPDPTSASAYTREPDGTPEGIAAEAEAWMPIVGPIAQETPKLLITEIVKDIFPRLPKAGITSFHDMGIFAPDLSLAHVGFDLLIEMEKEGRSPCRVVGVHGNRDAKLIADEQVGILKEWNRKYKTDLLEVTGLKIWADGTPDTHTAVQLEPYANKPETKGESDWTTAVLAKWIEQSYIAGFDVHIHCTGDGSVRRSLDAFETVEKKRGRMGRRSVIHHLTVIHPDDLRRFIKLGIGGNATLEWVIRDWQDGLAIFGEEKRTKAFDIWKRLIDDGVNVSFGSDIPGTDPDELAPLYQMAVMANERIPELPGKIPPPKNRILSLKQMVYGYTMAGAIQMRKEDQIGSIMPGKLADMIVLDKNVFEIPRNELFNTNVLMTMLDGKITHGW